MKTADNEESRLESVKGKVSKWKKEGYKVDELEDKIKDVSIQTPQTEVKPSIFTLPRSRYMLGVIALFVIIAVITGAITGSINLDSTGSLSVDDTEETNDNFPVLSSDPLYVLLSDETTSTNTLIGEWSTYYNQVSSLRIPPPETMTAPSPEVLQLPDPVYAFLDIDQLIYQQPPPIVAVPIYPTISETGEVQYIDIEGGFYGIITDDGDHYEPINLALEFMVDDLQISFKAKIMEDRVSYYMWGTIIEILEIEVLD